MRCLRLVAITFLCSQNVVGQKNEVILKRFITDPAVATCFAGIHITDVTTGKTLITYNSSKHFLPSSTVKLFTAYAALITFKDSIPAAYTLQLGDTFYFRPAGDPTLLHPDFKFQPLVDTARKATHIILVRNYTAAAKYGHGWAWDDYGEGYQVERSTMPVYGNKIWFESKNDSLTIFPDLFKHAVPFDYPPLSKKFADGYFRITRDEDSNRFKVEAADEKFTKQNVPFIPATPPEYLAEALMISSIGKTNVEGEFPHNRKPDTLRGYHIDSLVKPMLFISDNFIAEQLLLMASEKATGSMTDTIFISRLLKNDLRGIPDEPVWVDGSGLSRYNLFTPRDLTYIIGKLENEFGAKRIEELLPTGGEGTLKLYYQPLKGKIFAKTGSMSNHTSIAGILITASGKRLHFAVMADNFTGKGAEVRRAIERMLTAVAASN